MKMIYQTKSEMLSALGSGLKSARLALNISQLTAAERSGISLKAVRNLEEGRNSSTFSLLSLCAVLKRTDWLMTIAPDGVDESAFERRESRPRCRATPRRKEAAHV